MPPINWFNLMLLVGITCMILLALFAIVKCTPKWVFMVYSLYLLISKPPRESKKEKPNNVLFDDIVGVEDAKAEFQKILHMFQGKIQFKKLGVKLSHGVLIYGPPGTGKTTLVHALAQEAKVSFFPVSAWDIAIIGTNRGVALIKELLVEARTCSPSIVYIKDVDYIAGQRVASEFEPILFTIDTEMTKCDKDGSMVVFVAATNRVETWSPTFTRPSWFLRIVHAGKQTKDSRRNIVGLLLNKYIREEEKEAIHSLIVSQTPNAVWGELENIASISFLLAEVRDDHVSVDDVRKLWKGSSISRNGQADLNDDKDEPTAQEVENKCNTLSWNLHLRTS